MTVRDLIRTDHIADIPRASSVSRPGYGFGLKFAVHSDPAKSGRNGSVGEYNSGGLAGTIFRIGPAEEMIGPHMIRAPLRDSRTAGHSSRGWPTKRLSTRPALRGEGDRSGRHWERQRLHCHAPI